MLGAFTESAVDCRKVRWDPVGALIFSDLCHRGNLRESTHGGTLLGARAGARECASTLTAGQGSRRVRRAA
jgi:hypothetical protein